MNECVLVVDDDREIVKAIAILLEKEGYQVCRAYDGLQALDILMSREVHLILMDIMMPKLDGLSALMKIREQKNLPVIVLSAKGEETDKILGLSMGADDYIVKPFEIAELLARVATVLRRYHKTESRIVVGDVTVDTQSRVVTRDGKPVPLTAKEYALLLLFLQNKNIALFRETIYERVWESDYMGDSRTVDLHVQRLRKKLGWQERITAVYKVGYRLEVKE